MNIEEQNRAYYDSLEMDRERDFQKQLDEIHKFEMESKEKIRKLELEQIAKIEQIEKEQNQPSKEEMRQRRLKFYENKKND